ncbi:hypothetical protein, partial [Phyllobacterium sp. SB3]|uniref:hypothetical protein n=1 Tax=Phyllobacterium sp. SB3 TaxID=3156073 RepID=UPI0032AEB2A7
SSVCNFQRTGHDQITAQISTQPHQSGTNPTNKTGKTNQASLPDPQRETSKRSLIPSTIAVNKTAWLMGAFGNRQRRPALVVSVYRPHSSKLSTPILKLL